jgi:hypothetical protein
LVSQAPCLCLRLRVSMLTVRLPPSVPNRYGGVCRPFLGFSNAFSLLLQPSLSKISSNSFIQRPTCKQIFACSSDVLKRHRHAHIKYSVSSDLNPVTVPTLLRSVFGYGDPIPAYHVRSLEIWFDRTGFSDWKTYGFQTPIDEDTETSPIAWDYTDGETDTYTALLQHGPSGVLNLTTARTQLEDGCDGILKAVLLSICPRLRDVKFVMPRIYRLSTLSWLHILSDDAYNSRVPWSPGLKNLRTVAVGLWSETWMDIPTTCC